MEERRFDAPKVWERFCVRFLKKINFVTNIIFSGRGGGQVVRVLSFYSDYPSLSPYPNLFYSAKLYEMNENTQKGPF